ncbi:MAG: hypothetical protein KME28_12595 [Pelatocladus maniniholoensis HA4357-MV3]|jgi:hypothetical protein|uniref:Uncharacterized protein n=1 Tax=Pelatocladus maniniholoensis HA4357-MV3 TaxID=1117104 RepID=A0A9E3LTF7_9NOST|nr:hypothetical protein [Pelatocladus maniniholoensis HA4357-MV3]BAZ65599.1 hypothetical protein NIES4106_03380 [Fischerella sp. NIES-4106]
MSTSIDEKYLEYLDQVFDHLHNGRWHEQKLKEQISLLLEAGYLRYFQWNDMKDLISNLENITGLKCEL